MATNDNGNNDNQPKVIPPKEAGEESAGNTEETNKAVDKAGEEAANRLQGKRKERFNTTDAVLAEDDKHYENVRRNQAASFGEEYDPKADTELNPADIVPAPSQSQNNLKHPATPEYADPHMSKNYLGQPI